MKRSSLLCGAFTLLGLACHRSEPSALDGVVALNFKWQDPSRIPVCFINPEQASGYDTLLEDLETKVRTEYEKTSQVRFVSWGECSELTAETRDNTVRIYLDRDDSFSIGGGVSLVGATRGNQLDDCEDCTMRIGINHYDKPWGKTATLSTAVHEFGHAAGLYHEHERADRSDVCQTGGIRHTRVKDESSSIRYIDEYDPDSIMNYCADRDITSLSPSDIRALDYLYGAIKTFDQNAFTYLNGVLPVANYFRSSQDAGFLGMEIPEAYRGKTIMAQASFAIFSGCARVGLVSMDTPNQEPLAIGDEEQCTNWIQPFALELTVPDEGRFAFGIILNKGVGSIPIEIAYENLDFLSNVDAPPSTDEQD
ncbi:M12 family metallopeptidase [Pseudobacteriovorax antillogorgiicola]|uniref:Astacin (Peptidase family M12A) n=1 Tax=Pseudobacteriovorax antillogorgiicola TaxID=1513793 RepID=A0A1Y6CBT4_9BACT|nr:M12 family metallopeptidase [Pseudobacteriovorax antillogorgiicola]TCS48970.1 astacin (peptidase family M12A) [Pseudobacteriovorax antillogorgiicola]SMF53566.1 Astacin (Peptidase family M12A) [Pseudobacteriovorax antillogorgiicola]